VIARELADADLLASASRWLMFSTATVRLIIDRSPCYTTNEQGAARHESAHSPGSQFLEEPSRDKPRHTCRFPRVCFVVVIGGNGPGLAIRGCVLGLKLTH